MGVVINPEVAQRAGVVHCSYQTDGNSMGSGSGGCGGATNILSWGREGLKEMMEGQEGNLFWREWCLQGSPSINGASSPGTAEDRSGCQYNEVVLDGRLWTSNLPSIVQAVFYPVNGHVDTTEGDVHRARAARGAFMDRFGLSQAELAPLLTYDVGAARSGRAPWAVAPPG
jgi:hypothetical protein